MTEEGKVKQRINQILKQFPNIYRIMPVPFGIGASTLDYILCVNGHFVAIEAKAAGKEPTERQDAIIKQIERAGGKVFIIDGTAGRDSYKSLEHYLRVLTSIPVVVA